MNRIAIAAAALALCTLNVPAASAKESLSARAVTAIGIAIAAQGDAALVQIRRELEQSAVEAMKPFIGEPEKANESTPPATASVVQL